MHIAATIQIALLASLLSALAVAPPALAQALAVGKLEVKAYQAIPKTKTAVQLSADTHLSRELRREVMTRLARRGNEVGFSGGNVMRMDVSYLDLSGDRGGTGSGTIGGIPSYDQAPGSNPRPDLPSNPISRRDRLPTTPKGSTLRITLTLYAVDTGKVLWMASASCAAQGDNVQRTGEAMIDAIFADADKSHTGDAGCPL